MNASGGQKNRFKICSTTKLAKGLFSQSAQKQRSKSNQNNLKNPFCIGLFAIQNDGVARSYRFSVPLTNQDNNKAKGLLPIQKKKKEGQRMSLFVGVEPTGCKTNCYQVKIAVNSCITSQKLKDRLNLFFSEFLTLTL